MMTQERADFEFMRSALRDNPTLTLLSAYSRHWVLPLFAEHLESVDESVSAEWFHERVAEALEQVRDEKDWQGERSPSEHCRKWVDSRWLETEAADGRTRYRLSPYSLRALRLVREIAAGESTVSGARLGSIAHALRRLADMTSPGRQAHVRRIDEEIEQLRRRRQEIEAGEARLATTEQMLEQLREILAMTRSLPADFWHLRSMVEERHKAVARGALAATPKAELVEEYLHENDLLSQTPEGIAYRGFARMLASSQEADTIRRDVDQILSSPFADDHMTAAQRHGLDSMFSTLLRAEMQVQVSYLRWTSSLRRIITRAAHGRNARLLSAIEQALDAASAWVEAHPGARVLDDDVLRVGRLGIEDVSQLQLWRDTGSGSVTVSTTSRQDALPANERAALRLVAGTGRRAVARTIDRLLKQRGIVTGSEVYEEIPQEFQRLGTLVSLLDLAVTHGRVDTESNEQVVLAGIRERELRALLPRMVFDRPIRLIKEIA